MISLVTPNFFGQLPRLLTLEMLDMLDIEDQDWKEFSKERQNGSPHAHAVAPHITIFEVLFIGDVDSESACKESDLEENLHCTKPSHFV